MKKSMSILNVKKKISVKIILLSFIFLCPSLMFTNGTNAMFLDSEEKTDCSNIYNSSSQSDDDNPTDDDNPSKIPLLPREGEPDYDQYVEQKVEAWKEHNKYNLVTLPVDEFDENLSYVKEQLNIFDNERTQKYREGIEHWTKETNEAPSIYRNSIATIELMKKRGLGKEFDKDFTDLAQCLPKEYKCEYVLANLDSSLKQADIEYNDKVNKLHNELIVNRAYCDNDCDKELNWGRIKVEYPVIE